MMLVSFVAGSDPLLLVSLVFVFGLLVIACLLFGVSARSSWYRVIEYVVKWCLYTFSRKEKKRKGSVCINAYLTIKKNIMRMLCVSLGIIE